MENTITKNIENEEEISLIDLFAVVIRYRKLIIIGTFIATLIASLFLFVAPLFSKSFDFREVDVTYSIKVNEFSDSLKEKIFGKELIKASVSKDEPQKAYSIGSSFANKVLYLPFLSAEYKKFPIFSSDSDKELTSRELNTFIAKLVKDKKIEVKTSFISNTYDINFVISEKKLELAESFVKDIVVNIEADSQKEYLPKIKLLRKNTEDALQSLKSSFSSVNDLSTLQTMQDTIQEIDTFMSSFNGFFTIENEPFVISVAQGRVKKLAIVIFASLFLFIFISFAMNAVENIKKDPEASKTISDAWKAGK